MHSIRERTPGQCAAVKIWFTRFASPVLSMAALAISFFQLVVRSRIICVPMPCYRRRTTVADRSARIVNSSGSVLRCVSMK